MFNTVGCRQAVGNKYDTNRLLGAILAMFSSNTGGLYWPSNPANGGLWQNSARTTPCTAAGDPVGAMDDRSGNGNHLLQATSGKRPILRNGGRLWWLEFDGINDDLQSAFTQVQPITRISAARMVTWVNTSYLWDGALADHASLGMSSSTPQVLMYAGGAGPYPTASEMTVGVDHVVTEVFNGASSKLAIDNAAYATAAGTGTTNPAGLTLGSSGNATTAFGNFLFYGCIDIGRVLSDLEIAKCRAFFGGKNGLRL